LSIVRKGIVDYGDGPKGYTALDLVMAALECGLADAYRFLDKRLGCSEGAPDIAFPYANGAGDHGEAGDHGDHGEEADDNGDSLGDDEAGDGGAQKETPREPPKEPWRPGTVIVSAAAIVAEPVRWLWEGHLAKGKLNLLGGSPNAGKTTIALSFAATVSSGGVWPDGTIAEPGNVLIWTSEDGAEDTLIPRLTRMGADLNRIGIVTKQRTQPGKIRPFNPAEDMPSLMKAAAKLPGGLDLLMLDPVTSVIGPKANSHNNAETRNSLQPVVDFAAAIACVALGVTHFTKGTSGRDPLERITGSLAFGAVPRVVHVAAKNNSADGPPRVFTCIKNNLGPESNGFGYDLEDGLMPGRPDIHASAVVWGDPLPDPAKKTLAMAEGDGEDDEDNSKLARAEKLLEAMLGDGERPYTELAAFARMNGISEMTLRRAARTKRVVKRKEGFVGSWLWSLP
jgi:hypothetical protein